MPMDIQNKNIASTTKPPFITSTTAATLVVAVNSQIITLTGSLSSYYITSLSLGLLIDVIITIF